MIMKICILANMNSMIDSHSTLRVNYFIKKGYKKYVITYPTDEIKESKNARIYFIKEYRNKVLAILMNIIRVRKIVKKVNPDILHAHYAGVNGALGALCGFHPFFVTVFGSDIFENSKSRIRRVLIRFILKKADIIICNGETLKRKIIELGGDISKIRIIRWGTDTQKFKKLAGDRKLKKELRIGRSLSVISIRNLFPVYDVETFMRAIPLVLKKIHNVIFIVAGIGPEESRLKKLADSLKINEHVRFVGWIDNKDVSKYLNLADVYVSTSLSDGDLSQSTQQAMACQLPIITTDIFVNKTRIKDGINGFLFPIKNSELLAKKIIILLKDKNIRRKIGNEARKTIVSELDFFGEMKKLDNLYKEIIK